MQIDYIKIVNMTYLLDSSDKISTKTLQDKRVSLNSGVFWI